jgi:hypothetical protein
MLSFKAKGTEAVINVGFEIDSANMLQAAHNLKYPVHIGVTEDTITKSLIDRFGPRLNGSLTFGLQRLPPQVLEGVKATPGSENLAGYESVGLTYVHVKQLARALQACRGQGLQCQLNHLNQSPPDSDIGFEGWNNRIARLRTITKEYKDGELREIGSYIPQSPTGGPPNKTFTLRHLDMKAAS